VVSGVAVYTNGIAVRRFDDATNYTTAKNLIAALVLVIIAVAASGARETRAAITTAPKAGIAAVAVAGSVPFVLFFEGLSRVDSTDAAFLHKTLVVWVAIGAVAVLGERVRWNHLVAIVAILWGQHELVGGFGLDDPGSGEALITTATLIWAVEVIITKRMLAATPAAAVSAARMGGGAVLLVAWAALRGALGGVVAIGWSDLGWVLLTGVVLAAFVALWHRALATAPAIDVTAILAGGAVVTALLNSASGRASIGPAALGLALVAAGSLMVAMPVRTASPTGAASP
jgi:drug/metabolite transporter (DMT)-like permease